MIRHIYVKGHVTKINLPLSRYSILKLATVQVFKIETHNLGDKLYWQKTLIITSLAFIDKNLIESQNNLPIFKGKLERNIIKNLLQMKHHYIQIYRLLCFYATFITSLLACSYVNISKKIILSVQILIHKVM